METTIESIPPSSHAVQFNVGIQDNLVTLAFDRQISSVGMDPDAARRLASTIRQAADHLQGIKSPRGRRRKSPKK